MPAASAQSHEVTPSASLAPSGYARVRPGRSGAPSGAPRVCAKVAAAVPTADMLSMCLESPVMTSTREPCRAGRQYRDLVACGAAGPSSRLQPRQAAAPGSPARQPRQITSAELLRLMVLLTEFEGLCAELMSCIDVAVTARLVVLLAEFKGLCTELPSLVILLTKFEGLCGELMGYIGAAITTRRLRHPWAEPGQEPSRPVPPTLGDASSSAPLKRLAEPGPSKGAIAEPGSCLAASRPAWAVRRARDAEPLSVLAGGRAAAEALEATTAHAKINER